TISKRDWSSDVCSSELGGEELLVRAEQGRGLRIDGEDVEADDVDRVDRVHERAGRGGVPGLVERLGVRGQQLAHVHLADAEDRLHVPLRVELAAGPVPGAGPGGRPRAAGAT